MTTNNRDDDLALQTLMSVRAEIAPDLDEQMLRQCYAVQREHQFSADRVQPSRALERLIDEAVNAAAVDSSPR
jgi:hypothetical protein